MRIRPGAGTGKDRGAATVAQFQVAGDEAGVEMGEEHLPDLKAEFSGIVEVLLNIALGVDDDSGRDGLVSERIRSVGEVAQIVLFEKNGKSLFAR